MAKRKSNRSREGRSPRREKTLVAAPPKPWFLRLKWWQQTAILVGGTGLVVGGHFALWGAVFPLVGRLVGRVPVLSTVVGWAFAGGAFAAIGVALINYDSAGPATRSRLKLMAWLWGLVGLLCIPSTYANRITLPSDFWAGVYAGAYGVIGIPVAAGVCVALWKVVAKLFRRKGEGTKHSIGWVFVGYAFLLLVWGSSLLRM